MCVLGRIVRVNELYRTSRMVALVAASLIALAAPTPYAQGPIPSAPQPQQQPQPQPSQQPQVIVPKAPAAQGAKQPAATQQVQDMDTPVLKVQSNEVDLVFTVTDKKGHFVTGLNQSSFGLLDDGRPPEAVLHFYQQTNLPLRVGIMLDTSSSIRGRFEFEQDSAIAFLQQVMHQNDRAFVEGFDVEVDLAQKFTGNIDQLNQGIRKLRPGGGTALRGLA